jgi:hypothetical protein
MPAAFSPHYRASFLAIDSAMVRIRLEAVSPSITRDMGGLNRYVLAIPSSVGIDPFPPLLTGSQSLGMSGKMM